MIPFPQDSRKQLNVLFIYNQKKQTPFCWLLGLKCLFVTYFFCLFVCCSLWSLPSLVWRLLKQFQDLFQVLLGYSFVTKKSLQFEKLKSDVSLLKYIVHWFNKRFWIFQFVSSPFVYIKLWKQLLVKTGLLYMYQPLVTILKQLAQKSGTAWSLL